MRRLLNKLSTAWLVLALIVAPLQAAASPLAPGDRDDCPMTKAASHAAHAMHQQMDHMSSSHDMAACPACSDTHCNDGQCQAGGCCVPHLQPGIHATAPAVRVSTTIPLPADIHTTFSSQPPAPLYRPPV